MSNMKVIRFYPPGGPEKLRYETEDIPKPSYEVILVKVRAVGLIWPELSWPIYQDANGNPFPHIPGHDFSGVVEAIGPDVNTDDISTTADLKPGSEVYAFTSETNHEGAMAGYALADLAQVVPKPRNLSFEEAASVPLTALTAWQALIDHGNLQPGQKLLVTGAAGATGIWAVQFARMIGAYVIGTGSSKRSQELLNELGVDQFINYKEVNDLGTTIHDVDLVFDCVGGEALEQCLKMVKKEGLVIGINTFDCKDVAQRHGGRGMFFIVSMNVQQLADITMLLEKEVVRPVIDSIFPLEQAAKAFETGAAGHSHGRIVLSVP